MLFWWLYENGEIMDSLILYLSLCDALVRGLIDWCNRFFQRWFHFSRFWQMSAVSVILACMSFMVVGKVATEGQGEALPFAVFLMILYIPAGLFMACSAIAFYGEHLFYEREGSRLGWHAHQKDLWYRFIAVVVTLMSGWLMFIYSGYLCAVVFTALLSIWYYLMGCSDLDKGDRKSIFARKKANVES
jgi:hypothetical protein